MTANLFSNAILEQRKKSDFIQKDFSFIDLFAGIGGKCVFSSEINEKAAKVYEANFEENPLSDVTQIEAKTLPDFDLLCAGFPCQPFSISGKKKGFEDTRGTLFFDICRIIDEKKTKGSFA
ncbi:DNA (cytosine-5-)-methyltransferase [Campylobacter upsaliensis]|uniref:DNA (cytosine-5-)-methyltransferase n=1 Tax=Campylobacter upsaliensis TaxID=28080 RepID=UPI0022EA407F|nr:DNA (cytosine-5-)-methyltransferase [Campylobacter upsaliensis]